MTTIGFNERLYILPFDHRGSFQTKMFGWSGALTSAQTAEIAAAKQVIYDGFKAALDTGISERNAGILVDEQFGAAILQDATAHGYTTACPAEKSGQEQFDFEYSDEFAQHIETFQPTFCKVLVRYNPEGDLALNQRQANRLRTLSDYLHSRSRSKFMFELLVPAEKSQLDEVSGDKKAYDLHLRPALMAETITRCRMLGSSQMFGRSRASTGRKIARRLSRLRVAAIAAKSVASFSAVERTIKRCASGSPLRPQLTASSDSLWDAPPSGVRWLTCAHRRSRARPQWPRLPAAIGNS